MLEMCFVWIFNFNVILHTGAIAKLIGNLFCTPIIFRNPIRNGYEIDICILFLICSRFVWIIYAN